MITKMDACDALWVFTALWSRGQFVPPYSKYSGLLANLGYSPGLSTERCKLTTPGSRRAYRILCQRYGV